MTETATLMPLSTFIPVFTAISDRDWVRFKELEVSFAPRSRDRNLGRCFQLENHARTRTRG
ncbi:hypothetical protein [Nostoc sphaeroides]|uniref:hypothetical protein n=1 Tax=Nostoc sphaeroides TaxID=446679 RepID=UPI002B3FFD3D|nr:hypothetical protein [Nostoc sphaeroides]